MIITKSKGIIASLAILVVGYAAGALFGYPTGTDEFNGDIGKAKLYNKSTGETANVGEEMLRNDSIYRGQLIESLVLLNYRINETDSIVDVTITATEGVEPLAELHKEMLNLQEKAKNAKAIYDELFVEIDKVLGGESSGNFEVLLNNASLAFGIVDDMTSSSCADYVSVLSNYGLEQNNTAVLGATAAWIEFGAEDAIFSGSENVSGWEEVYAAAQSEPSLACHLSNQLPTLQMMAGNALALSSKTLGNRSQNALNQIIIIIFNNSALNNNVPQRRLGMLNQQQNALNNNAQKGLGNSLQTLQSRQSGLKSACKSSFLNVRVM